MTAPSPRRYLIMVSVRWYNACAEYAVRVAEGLRARGHETLLLVQPESPAEAEARARGLPVTAEIDLASLRAGDVLARVRALRRVIDRFAPHAVNAHRSEDHLLAALALRGSGIPLVRTRGDVRPPRRHPANRFLYRRATAFHIACADFMPLRYYAPLGVDPNRVRVIRPGLDVDAFQAGAPTRGEARQRLGLDPTAFWIGQVGRLTVAKGPQVLLESAATLPPEPSVRLLLCGEAKEWSADALLARAYELGLAERVIVRDRQPDVRTALRALDVLAVPSLASEAISRIAMEALALGVPVVASRVNALPEVVGDAGLLVPPGDAAALGRALARLQTEESTRRHAEIEGPQRIRRRYDREIQLDLTLDVLGAGSVSAPPRSAAGPR